MKVTLNVLGLTLLTAGRFEPVLEAVKLADRKGVDQVALGEHLALIPESFAGYHRGTFAYPVDYPYYEPIATLAAFASVTQRIRLSTNVLVSPLRPALLLAKQVGMLDVISNGRVDIGLGVGWQKAEFEAAEMPWERRYAYIAEQIRVCRALWKEAPANFEGERVRFRNLYMLPLPPQRDKLPIWLGYDPKPKNIERIAEQADGWAGPPKDPEVLAEGVKAIHAAMQARGRDTQNFPVRTTLRPVKREDGSTDWDASFARAPEYAKAGVNMLAVIASQYCRSADEVPALIERLLALKSL
jgi:probable F420-dependent oxidoreductase